MTDPLAPQIPADAPQDVKDFFDCKGDKLVWKKGPVTWLGLGVTPNVSFEAGSPKGTIKIRVTVGEEPFAFGFDLPASVNANGELTVDTSSVPDLSTFGLGGRTDIDAAIKRINDWFKKNGKKLKPATLKGDDVILEKTPLAAAAPPAVPVVPATPKPATPLAPPPPPTATTPAPKTDSGGWCSLLGGILAFLFFGVIAIGGAIGFAFMGGPPQTPFNPGRTTSPTVAATATPAATQPPTAAPTQSPTQAPTQAATVVPTQAPTHSPTQAPTQTPQATATAAATPLTVTYLCIRVVHEQLGAFLSYLDVGLGIVGLDVDYFELTIIGANNGEPQTIEYDPLLDLYTGQLGLMQAGDKQIVSLTAHLTDGTTIDMTQELIDSFGTDEFTVRFPEEDTFGTCPTT